MSSPMLQILPPTQDQIRAQVAQSMPALEVYNPSPNWVKQQVSARWFYIPPDLDGEKVDHPYLSTYENRVPVKADGILYVRPIYDKKKNTEIVSAQDIVAVILSDRSRMGMCYLPPGDEKIRTQLRSQALAVWEQFRVKQAELEMDAWGEKLAAFNSNPANKGKVPPRPPKRVHEAIEFLDLYAEGEKEGHSFKCKDCGFRTNESLAWSRHERVNGHEAMPTPGNPETAKGRKAKQE